MYCFLSFHLLLSIHAAERPTVHSPLLISRRISSLVFGRRGVSQIDQQQELYAQHSRPTITVSQQEQQYIDQQNTSINSPTNNFSHQQQNTVTMTASYRLCYAMTSSGRVS